MHYGRVIAGTCLLIGCLSLGVPGRGADEAALQEQMKRGQEIFSRTCITCHQADGQGLQGGLFPPLAGSDFFMADKARALRIVLNGLTGPVTVNGVTYDNVMPAWKGELNDQEIADVMTFERNSWGNHGEAVTPEEVARARSAG